MIAKWPLPSPLLVYLLSWLCTARKSHLFLWRSVCACIRMSAGMHGVLLYLIGYRNLRLKLSRFGWWEVICVGFFVLMCLNCSLSSSLLPPRERHSRLKLYIPFPKRLLFLKWKMDNISSPLDSELGSRTTQLHAHKWYGTSCLCRHSPCPLRASGFKTFFVSLFVIEREAWLPLTTVYLFICSVPRFIEY